MVRNYLDKYCVLLNKDIYEEYTPYGLLVDFRFYLPKLKSEILTNCLEFEIDKKIEYLNLVSNEVSNLIIEDWKNISVYDVLVGDIQEVSTGEILSVDGVLIEGFNLIADESAMTG
jgi:Ca2+-transporting ATPase